MSLVLTTIPLEKGFLPGLGILSPPKNDEWWNGDLINFESKFDEIAKSVPLTMTDKSFEEIKLNIKSSNRNEPVEWNESKITFFSEFFMKFLEEKGKHEHFHSAAKLRI
jgi:hypothetical protein